VVYNTEEEYYLSEYEKGNPWRETRYFLYKGMVYPDDIAWKKYMVHKKGDIVKELKYKLQEAIIDGKLYYHNIPLERSYHSISEMYETKIDAYQAIENEKMRRRRERETKERIRQIFNLTCGKETFPSI
jgi:hypothetical protein